MSQVEIGFDEAEAKKLDTLAQQFLTDDVADVPKQLEETINGSHNKNATLLVNNASKLRSAASDLENVLEMLSEAVKASEKVRKDEADVYRHLQSIDSNRDKDAAVVNHQKEVKEKLEEILEVAKIPNEVRSALTNPALGDIMNLDALYDVVQKATADRYAKEPPKILQGLAVAERRVEELDKLLTMFQHEFKKFMQGKLGDVKACERWVDLQEEMIKSAEKDPGNRPMPRKIPGIDKESLIYVPTLNERGERKKFSADLTSHKVIRSVFPYWKLFYWIREYFPDCYHDIIYGSYLTCEVKCAKTDWLTPLAAAWTFVQQYKEVTHNDPFRLGEDIGSATFHEVSEKVKNGLSSLFTHISQEACIVAEFWQIDDLHFVEQIISKEVLESLTKMCNAVTIYDPFFAMKCYGIVLAHSKASKVPVNFIVEIPKRFWDEYLRTQRELLAELKVAKTKTSVLAPFRDFPKFAQKYSEVAEDTERPVLEKSLAEMADDLVDWLITRIAPKFSKKKRARLIVLNISHLCDKMDGQDFVKKSEVLMENLQKQRALLEANIRVLLKFIVSKNWLHASRFFDQISDWMEFSGLTCEMVTFQPSHTQEKFVELNERIEKRLATCVSECYSYMKKKIRHDGMRQVLRASIVPFVQEQFELWNQMALDCYDLKLSVTPEKVAQMMSDHQ